MSMIRKRSIETMTSFRRIVAIHRGDERRWRRPASIRPFDSRFLPRVARENFSRKICKREIFSEEKYFQNACPYLEILNVRFNPADVIGTHSFVKRIAINESEWFRFWSGGGLIRANCNETINQNSFNNEIQCSPASVSSKFYQKRLFIFLTKQFENRVRS